MDDFEDSARRATSKDFDTVVSLDRESFVGQDRGPLLAARLQSGEVILLERDGRALGYAVVRARSFFGHDFLEVLVVARDERRRGAGGFLLNSAVSLSSTERIFTSTNRSNSPMTALLDKQGWRLSGQLEGIDEEDPELVYYQDS
ncbi:MAG: GNAT family N-acetyltransferase [Acidimicrobiaceae bacterium]|nr:GNAT family N-acetyltransferase [Acidimicrobiaceae bacterium]